MSVHPRFDNPEPVACLDTAPIVLRFASLFPRDLKRRDMHGKRKGGDLSHIREDMTGLNYTWVGEEGWIDQLHRTIAEVADYNLENEVEAREKKGRWKEAEDVRKRGLVDPWKFTREGPLREGILTVNKRWFGGTGIEDWDPERVAMFLDRAVAFLEKHFPGGQLVEVESHVDEEAFHFHLMVVVWAGKASQDHILTLSGEIAGNKVTLTRASSCSRPCPIRSTQFPPTTAFC